MKRRLFQILVAFGQNGFLLGFTNKAIYQGSLKEYCTPTLNCYACPGAIFACPIGTIQHFAVVGGAIPAYVAGLPRGDRRRRRAHVLRLALPLRLLPGPAVQGAQREDRASRRR